MKKAIVVAVAIGTSVSGIPSLARAQSSGGVVTGRVTDSAGARIGSATVSLVSTASLAGRGSRAVSSTSDDSGAFRLTGLPAGRVVLAARRLGYAPETLLVTIALGREAAADFALRAIPTRLKAELIEADVTRGKMGAFNKRKSRGVGAFITRDEIERRQAASVSELLRYLPGVGVTQKMAGEPQPIHMQRSVNSSMQSTCVVQLYVDGHPYPNGSVDDFQPMSVEGIEVYRSASEIPADFRTQDATCGVIALWTRDPDAARRRP